MKLSDICKYRNEKINLKDINENEYVSTDNMLPNFAGLGELKSFPNVDRVNKFCRNDILLSNIRPYFKKMILSDNNSGCSSDVLVIETINKDVNPKFLYYRLRLDDFFDYVILTSKGTKMPRGDKKAIMNFELEVPKLDIQNKIVKIIENIDKKIELNNKINNNLYEMLKDIYKELYLNNSSYKNWKSMTLDDVTSKFATGLNPRKNFVLGQGNNYYVTIKNMQNNQVVLDSKCDRVDDEALVKINKRSDLKVGDLLFSGIGTIGRTYLIKNKPTNWNVSESVFTIRPNNKISSEFLYLLLLDSDMQNYAVSKASGSVQKGIRMADLKLYKLNVPEKEWMEAFTNTVRPLIDKIYLNYEMNDKLCKLRDALLPKLMNDEIDLDNIEI